ncbi:MAG TPA: hypothetical protein ENK43_12960 [Planctomycetes bacterium]|nr:hypothetical protein [Planctomycetota bacterium]
MRWLLGMFLGLIALNGVALFIMGRIASNDVPRDVRVAERFLNEVMRGNDSSSENDDVIGYAAAHDLLTSRAKESMDFATFVARFEDRVPEWGLMDGYRKESREEGDFTRRILYFRLRFTGTQGAPVEVPCRIVLVRKDDKYLIDAFTMEGEPR